MNNGTFTKQFEEEGALKLPDLEIKFKELPWHPHAAFDGVELKHLVTSEHTEGKFSYHFVRIAPNKKIGRHIHEKQLETHEVISGSGTCFYKNVLLEYTPGVVSIMEQQVEHEVTAGDEGLFLFAKFMPALL